MPKRDADDRPRIAGDAPSSRGAAAATVRVDRARAAGLPPVPAQHTHAFRVAEDMVRRASRSATTAERGSQETGRHVFSRPMKTPHSKGSRDQFPVRLEVKELSFSQPRGESRHLLHSRGGNVSSGTGLRAVRRGWRLPCPRTSRRRRPAAMPSITRGRVTVRPRAPAARPPAYFPPSVKRALPRLPSADSRPSTSCPLQPRRSR